MVRFRYRGAVVEKEYLSAGRSLFVDSDGLEMESEGEGR